MLEAASWHGSLLLQGPSQKSGFCFTDFVTREQKTFHLLVSAKHSSAQGTEFLAMARRADFLPLEDEGRTTELQDSSGLLHIHETSSPLLSRHHLVSCTVHTRAPVLERAMPASATRLSPHWPPPPKRCELGESSHRTRL